MTERENDEKTNIQKWVADIVTDLHASVKFIFIGNLSALKGIQKYVGIRPDLTSDDRKAYKQLSVEATSRNKSDPCYVWRRYEARQEIDTRYQEVQNPKKTSTINNKEAPKRSKKKRTTYN